MTRGEHPQPPTGGEDARLAASPRINERTDT